MIEEEQHYEFFVDSTMCQRFCSFDCYFKSSLASGKLIKFNVRVTIFSL